MRFLAITAGANRLKEAVTLAGLPTSIDVSVNRSEAAAGSALATPPKWRQSELIVAHLAVIP